MPRKTVRARERLAQGNFTLPSPEEVQRIGPTGGFKSMQLAEWGVPWPPPAGWRHELRQRYEAQQRGEPLPPIPAVPAPPPKTGPRRPNGNADRAQRRQDVLDRLARGDFTLPSPEQLRRRPLSALQLAEWGVPWPPPEGWDVELRRRYEAAQRGSGGEPAPPRLSVVVDMPQQVRRPSTVAVLAEIRLLDDFDLLMLLTDIERRGLREAVRAFGLVPAADVTSR